MSSSKDVQAFESLSAQEVQQAIDAMFAYLRDVLYSPKQARLNVGELAEPFRDLAEGMLYIGKCVNESRDLANDLARGNLDSDLHISSDNDIASGLKNLQSTLKHISWQVGQVAKGDYHQRLSFAGEFTEAINGMIDQLKERDDALRAEIKLNQRIASESRNTVLFLEGITKSIAEWIVVIDRENHDWLYTNHSIANYLPNKASAEELKEILKVRLDEYNKQLPAGRPEVETPLQSLVELVGEDGSISQFFSIIGYPLSWMDRKAIVMVLIDVTDEHRKREQLEQVAYYDELTKTYSRHFGMETLERWVDEGQSFVIAFIDMDGLKYVNDTFGHAAGDQYILATAEGLSDFSDDIILSRLGGDEFMLLARFTSAGMTRLKLDEIRRTLDREFKGEYERSFSFGVVEVDNNNTKSASLLLSLADESMYEDKRLRKKERRAQD